MSKLIVYFHGYGSSANSSKVEELRSALPNYQICAFDISMDYHTAKEQLHAKILDAMLDNFVIENVIFYGTSLGAYWALTMSREFHNCKVVLANPSMNPAVTLKKYGVDDAVLADYPELKPIPTDNAKYFFAEIDDVLDNTKLIGELGDAAIVVPGEDHRFYKHGMRFIMNTMKEWN